MIDNEIEKALAPDKVDWKEPLWAKFRNYVIGFGAALLVVGVIVAAIAYFAPPLAPDDAPSTMTIETIAQTQSKVIKPAIKKEAAKAVNKPIAPEAGITASPLKPKTYEPLTQFDRDLAEFERKIP